jgi:hypothetical protein
MLKKLTNEIVHQPVKVSVSKKGIPLLKGRCPRRFNHLPSEAVVDSSPETPTEIVV